MRSEWLPERLPSLMAGPVNRRLANLQRRWPALDTLIGARDVVNSSDFHAIRAPESRVVGFAPGTEFRWDAGVAFFRLEQPSVSDLRPEVKSIEEIE